MVWSNIWGLAKKILIILLVLLLLTVFLFPLYSADDPAPQPLKAYRATHVPTIDGVKSPGEWDDTQPYLCEKTVPSEMTLATDKAIMSLYLKHDTKNLYILFTINDDDYDNTPSSSDSLTIFWKYNYTMGLIVYSNGSIYHGGLTGSGIFPDDRRPIDEDVAKAAVTYNQDNYTFEISININHFFELSYKNQIRCSIIYDDANYTGSPWWSNHYIGFLNSVNTIALLSEPYYSSYFSPFGIWILGAVIIVVLVALMLKIKKRGEIRK